MTAILWRVVSIYSTRSRLSLITTFVHIKTSLFLTFDDERRRGFHLTRRVGDATREFARVFRVRQVDG